MKQENSILQNCLEHLQALPDIQASLKSFHASVNKSANGIINISSPLKSVDYAYTIQPDVNGKIVELVVAYLKRYEEKAGQKLLLMTRYLPDTAIKCLLDENIEFIDSAGNTYLNSRAAYILIRGKHRPKEKISSIQITPNSLKLIYILLKSPNILELSFKELANTVGLTTRTVSQNLKNLYQLGYLQRQRNGSYRIADYIKLLERWEIGYAETLRPKLLLGTFTSVGEPKFSQVAENIINLAKEQDFLIGGELGAAIVTSYLNPIGARLHVLDNHRLIAAKLKLKPSPQGEITFIQQFGVNNSLGNNQK